MKKEFLTTSVSCGMILLFCLLFAHPSVQRVTKAYCTKSSAKRWLCNPFAHVYHIISCPVLNCSRAACTGTKVGSCEVFFIQMRVLYLRRNVNKRACDQSCDKTAPIRRAKQEFVSHVHNTRKILRQVVSFRKPNYQSDRASLQTQLTC